MTPSQAGGAPPGGSRLQEEIQQSVPFKSRAQEAFLSLLRTADLARNRFTDLFGPEGVTFQQYNVLRILRGAGPAGLPTLEIGARMIERTPGVTRIIDRLEAKGWVERERCATDRRQVFCRITPAGSALLARLDRPVDANDDAMFADIPEGDLEVFIRVLDELRSSLGACSADSLQPSEPTRRPM